ncbi:MAG TPA: chorismate pyruvate-lyase family protein [Candidatus Saccharimonadales bacterium]
MNITIKQKDTKLTQDFQASSAFLTLPTDNSFDSQAKRTLWHNLHPIQRALLATDGSMTLLLAALHKETIKTKLIAQKQSRAVQAHEPLQLEKGTPLLERTVLLMAAESNRPVTYAESTIVLSRLSAAMRRDLAKGAKPIGLLLRREALETHRTLQNWGVCPAPDAAKEIFRGASLLFRTYQIIARAVPIMIISEYFPYLHNNEGGHYEGENAKTTST